MPPIQHMRCQWAESPESKQDPISVAMTADGALVVRTVCPRCRGITVQHFADVVPGPGGYKGRHTRRDAPPSYKPRDRTIVCGCGMPHDGRSDAEMEYGCGAYWKVLA